MTETVLQEAGNVVGVLTALAIIFSAFLMPIFLVMTYYRLARLSVVISFILLGIAYYLTYLFAVNSLNIVNISVNASFGFLDWVTVYLLISAVIFCFIATVVFIYVLISRVIHHKDKYSRDYVMALESGLMLDLLYIGIVVVPLMLFYAVNVVNVDGNYIVLSVAWYILLLWLVAGFIIGAFIELSANHSETGIVKYIKA